MKFAEIKTKDRKTLESLLIDKKRERLGLRFALSSGECKTSDIRACRRDIARIKTYLAMLSSSDK